MKKLLHALLNLIGALLVVGGIFVAIYIILNLRDGELDTAKLAKIKSFSDVTEAITAETTESMIGEPIIVESVSFDRYAYQQLSEEEQQTYDQVYNCIINYDSKITLATKDKDSLARAYEAVMADYGNLFWVNGYQYNTYASNDTVVGLEFEPKYTMPQEQKDIYQTVVDAVVDDWLSGISPDASDFDKALYVFETLIDKVDYDTESKENQNILSVFMNQATVCQGYADAAWYMLDRLGIPCTIITGQANNESHAWNLVYMDDAYYYMDVTWGNSKYMDSNNDTAKRINYAYFAMTTEEISQNHMITSSFEVPECLSNADNYFVHKGLYYDWFGVDSIGNKLSESFAAGDAEISLKFSNSDLYNRVMDYFFTDKHIAEYCQGLESVYYLLDENANVITVKWE